MWIYFWAVYSVPLIYVSVFVPIPDSIKLLEENIGRTLYDINDSKIPFDPPPRGIEIKTKVNKWDLMKLKSFCTAMENMNKMRDRKSVV